MGGRHGTVVPCAIGNAMNLIARTVIRGTSEDATDIYVGNKEKAWGDYSPAFSIAFVGEPCVECFLYHPRFCTFLVSAEFDETGMQFGWTCISVVHEFLVAVSAGI